MVFMTRALTLIGITVIGTVVLAAEFEVKGTIAAENVGRETFEAAQEGYSTNIAEATIMKYCGDGDGCELRLGNRQTFTKSVALLMYINALGKPHWAISEPRSETGTDDDGVVDYVSMGNCRFGDATWQNGKGTDNDSNFGLVMVSGTGGCTLTIID